TMSFGISATVFSKVWAALYAGRTTAIRFPYNIADIVPFRGSQPGCSLQSMHRPTHFISLALPLVCLLIFFLWTSFYGLNFGTHWDENRAKFDAVRNTLRTGLFLQGSDFTAEGASYNHGGLNYLLIWCGLTPELFKYVIDGHWSRLTLERAIAPALDTTAV